MAEPRKPFTPEEFQELVAKWQAVGTEWEYVKRRRRNKSFAPQIRKARGFRRLTE